MTIESKSSVTLHATLNTPQVKMCHMSIYLIKSYFLCFLLFQLPKINKNNNKKQHILTTSGLPPIAFTSTNSKRSPMPSTPPITAILHHLNISVCDLLPMRHQLTITISKIFLTSRTIYGIWRWQCLKRRQGGSVHLVKCDGYCSVLVGVARKCCSSMQNGMRNSLIPSRVT